MTTVALIGLALLGCEDKPAPQATSPTVAVEAPTEATEAAKGAKTAAKTMVKEARGGKEAWHADLEGSDLPPASGMSVMGTNIGPNMTYSLIGTETTGSIMLMGAKKGQTGTFTPKSFSIRYPQKKIECGANTVGKGDAAGALTVTIEKAAKGVKGTFAGTVSCRNIGGSGEPKTAKISGWFED